MSLLTGLVAYWGFTDGSGKTAFDATARGNNGLLRNQNFDVPANDAIWTREIALGGGLIFNATAGVAPWVDLPDTLDLDLGTIIGPYSVPVFSLFAMFKTSYVAPNTQILGGYGGSPYQGYGLILNVPGTGLWSYWNSYSWNNGSPPYSVTDGNWHSIGVSVWDAGTGAGTEFYTDGVQTAGAVMNPPLSYRGVRCIASTPSATGGGNYLDGTIAVVAIWRRALGSSEQAQLYNGGEGLPYPFNIRRMGRPLGRKIIVP